MGENLQIFKMCRLGNPSFMKQLRALHPGADGLTFIQHEVEKLIDIPFIDELTVKMLIKELPAYFRYAGEFAGDWLFKPPTAPTTVAEVQLLRELLWISVFAPRRGLYNPCVSILGTIC